MQTYQKIIRLLLLSLIVMLVQESNAQTDTTLYDTSTKIESRSSDIAEDLRSDRDFDYDREYAEPPESLLQRLVYWIISFFRLVDEGGPVSWVFYGFLTIVIFIVVAKLLGFKYDSLLLRSKNLKSSNIEVFDEDIHTLDINQIIADSIREQNYRKAVRYAYLKLLKTLDMNEIIEWQPDKTNRDYHSEVSKTRFSGEFSGLTRIYEYVWYGEFDIDKDQFNHTYSVFNKVYKDLNEK